MSDEIGWLVERSSNGTAVWLKNTNQNTLTWTIESADALRFVRKVDAEVFISMLNIGNSVATEHIWSDI